jgi:hypothetical protein
MDCRFNLFWKMFSERVSSTDDTLKQYARTLWNSVHQTETAITHFGEASDHDEAVYGRHGHYWKQAYGWPHEGQIINGWKVTFSGDYTIDLEPGITDSTDDDDSDNTTDTSVEYVPDV